jgi:hypothetical protein
VSWNAELFNVGATQCFLLLPKCLCAFLAHQIKLKLLCVSPLPSAEDHRSNGVRGSSLLSVGRQKNFRSPDHKIRTRVHTVSLTSLSNRFFNTLNGQNCFKPVCLSRVQGEWMARASVFMVRVYDKGHLVFAWFLFHFQTFPQSRKYRCVSG